MSGESRIVLMPYNERWRMLRKIMHQILSSRQQDVFKPFQDLESKNLCWDYLQTPSRWWSANARYANSVIMSVVFGRRSMLDDPDVIELFETLELFLENQQPGVNIVDAFPIFDKMPKFLQWWRPRGERVFEKTVKCVPKEIAYGDPQFFKVRSLTCSIAGSIGANFLDWKKRWRTELNESASARTSSTLKGSRI